MACRLLRADCAPLAKYLSCCVLALMALLAMAPLAIAGGTSSGESSREARRVASRAIPWKVLSKGDRNAVSEVVRRADLYRKMPPRVIECDAEMFTLLTGRPELVVEVWNLMGVSKLTLDRVGPNRFRAKDTTGTVGDIRVLHAEGGGAKPQQVLVHCTGVYDAPPMPKPVTATCVMLFRSQAFVGADGRSYVRANLDSFVDFDRPTAGLIAKTLGPLVMRTADHNFVETMRFVSLFSRTAERSPAGMMRLAQHLKKVDAPTRLQFVQVCQRTAERSAQRLEQQQRVAVSPVVQASTRLR